MANIDISTMTFEQKLARINELAHKVKAGIPLTTEEVEERRVLRTDYIAGFRKSLQSQLDNMYILDENGNEQKITQKTTVIH